MSDFSYMKRFLIILLVTVVTALLLIAGFWFYLIKSKVSIASDKDLMNLPEGTREMVGILQEKITQWNIFTQPFLMSEKLSVIKFEIDYLLWINPKLKRAKMKEYAFLLLEAGRSREAIAQMEEYINETDIRLDTVSDSNIEYLKFLALSNLRIAEQENCILNHNSKSCTVPFAKEAIHINTEGTLNAAKLFTKILQAYPEDLGSRWLMNIIYQALGLYPDSVPKHLFIPLRDDYTGRESDFPKFEDIAGKLGIDADGVAGGAIADDFNNDGLLDLVVSSYGINHQLKYFENTGMTGFIDKTEDAGLTGLVGGFNIVQTDYDNDGLLDIFVLRGAWYGKYGRYPNSLIKNLGDGKFEDVTKKAGILSFYPTQVACWGDFNNDGWLDVFIGNEIADQTKHMDSVVEAYPSELYLNNADGTFANVAKQLNLEIYEFVKGATWTDYNNDGLQDLLVSIKGRKNKLFKNEGGTNQDDWKFTDVSKESGISAPIYSFPVWSFDYDNDGWEDLFLAENHVLNDKVHHEFAAEMLGLPTKAERSALYKNNRDGTFSNYTDSLRLDKILFAMGCNYGDIDNDGFLDFYIGTGAFNYEALMPNRMFRNFEGKYFEEVTYSGGFGLIQKGHGVSFADMDNDGDQDVYIVMGGGVEGDNFPNIFFENHGSGNSWITVKLKGAQSNRPAIGAKLKLVTVNANGEEQTFHRVISSGGSFGANPLQAQIGLGKAVIIKQLRVTWPNALHTVQHYENIQVNQFIHIHEGSDEIYADKRPALDFSEIPSIAQKVIYCQPPLRKK